MQPYHLIHQSQWMESMGTIALDVLLQQSRAYNR